MEKDENVFVIPSNFGWSDLGTWKSLWDVTEKDEHQNSMISKQTMSYDSQDNLVYSSPDKLVVINGVDNLVIVDSEEVLLVMNKDKEQEIKGIVNDVKSSYKGKYN
jgi:mannose-1-phosphate guanylyltransferase